MVLLISYDLNRDERPTSYAAVRDVIERHARSAIRVLYSQWLVETYEDVHTWRERVRAVADANDLILVVEVQNWSGWLQRDALNWLAQRV